jgi:hypothetical protein
MASSFPIKTALIRQVSASAAIQFSTNNSTWTNISTWPFTIGNNLPDNNILKVKFTTNITLPNIKSDYFILASPNIIIDGNNKSITVNNFVNFPGLITNGSATENGNNNITVKNISIGITGSSTLLSGQGWICKNYFGKGSTGNVIQNCSSSGPITTNSGGIAGQYTAINSTGFIISGCSASGSILDGAAGANAGGIVGANSGSLSTSFTITSCTYRGNINGNGSGGIIGARSTNFSITFCSSSGIIKGGGIAGDYTGIVTAANTLMVSISDCFSTGNIGSSVDTSGATSAGGIIGAYGGVVNITRCYSIGAIGGEGKNSCGGIVGGYGGGVSGGAVVVQSCFSTGNIYKDCGGIVGSYFGYNVFRGCNVYDCYSLGDIGDGAGGIVGPEFGAGALTICRISKCYSLGLLTTIASGGIIAPSTVTYPTTTVVSPTVEITRCFNSFNIGSAENSIVGLGLGVSVVGKTRSTFPKRQGANVPTDNTISSVTYGTTVNNTSLGAVAETFSSMTPQSQWYRLKSSSGAKSIIRTRYGYYKLNTDILGTVPFSKLDLLGFSVSDFILDGGYSLNDLFLQKINIQSTVDEFNKSNISLNDLFTSNISLSIIRQIGYTTVQVKTLRPNTTIREFIDAGYNYKTQGFTIPQMLSQQSTLTPLDLANAGFSSLDLKNSGRFTLLTMKQSGLTVRFLRGTYKDLELYNVGFNTKEFRLGGYNASILLFDLNFRGEEFAGSGYSVDSLTNGMSKFITNSSGNREIQNRPFSDSMLLAIGYSRSDIIRQQINYNFRTDPQMKTYAFFNAIASEIPKDAIITNIKDYPSSMFGAYKPADFITAEWTKLQVGKMGFTARSLLDSNYFDLRDLKTLNYSNDDILGSGHSSATLSAVNAATIYTSQPPPLITSVFTTEEGEIYIYIRQMYTNASADITGYAVSFNGDDYDLLEVANPLIVKGLTFEEDIYVYIKSYNGTEFSIDNYMSLAKKIKPRTLTSKKKPNWLKIGLGIGLVVATVALVAVTGGAALMAAPQEFQAFIAGSLAVGVGAIVVGSLERNYKWKEGDFSINPNFINKIPKFLKDILPINEINKYYKTPLLGSSLLVKSDENEVFLKTTATITSIYAQDGVATVNFTTEIKFNETIIGISYSTDDGTTWIQTTTTTSPLRINGFSKNRSVTICIRPLFIKNAGNVTSGAIVNYLYSQPTSSGTATNIINVGKWGQVSNTVTADMIITPYPPKIYHVQTIGTSTVKAYFIQYSNGGGGYIQDYEFSVNGTTWTPANLNLTGEIKKTNDWNYASNGELIEIFRDITITGLTSRPTNFALRSKTSNGVIGNSSGSIKTTTNSFETFIVSMGSMYKAR